MTDFSSIEELLSRAVPSPSEKYATSLRSLALSAYDRHYQPVRSKRLLSHRKQILGWASALAFIVFAFMAFTPTGRALAQHILQFSWFIFTNGPTGTEKYMTATRETSSAPLVVRADLVDAGAIAGFPVYYPTYLPEGYNPISRDPGSQVNILFNSSGAVIKVDTMLERTGSGEILAFSQIPLDLSSDVPPFNFGTGQVEPQFVDIDGNEGVWLENFIWGSKLDKTGEPIPVPYNLLIWEITTEDGNTFQFWLGSEERLPLNEMLRIAELIGDRRILR